MMRSRRHMRREAVDRGARRAAGEYPAGPADEPRPQSPWPTYGRSTHGQPTHGQPTHGQRPHRSDRGPLEPRGFPLRPPPDFTPASPSSALGKPLVVIDLRQLPV